MDLSKCPLLQRLGSFNSGLSSEQFSFVGSDAAIGVSLTNLYSFGLLDEVYSKSMLSGSLCSAACVVEFYAFSRF